MDSLLTAESARDIADAALSRGEVYAENMKSVYDAIRASARLGYHDCTVATEYFDETIHHLHANGYETHCNCVFEGDKCAICAHGSGGGCVSIRW